MKTKSYEKGGIYELVARIVCDIRVNLSATNDLRATGNATGNATSRRPVDYICIMKRLSKLLRVQRSCMQLFVGLLRN